MATFANGHKKVATPVVCLVCTPFSQMVATKGSKSSPSEIGEDRVELLQKSSPWSLNPSILDKNIDVSLVLKHHKNPMSWLFLDQNSNTRLDRELSRKDAWMLE